MNSNSNETLVDYFKEVSEMYTGEQESYSMKEGIKSNLNVHIYNANGRKKKLFISFFAPDDFTHLFPEEYRGWVLETTNLQRTANKNFLNSAHYIRDFTEKEHEEFDRFMEEQPDASKEDSEEIGQS